MMRDATPESRPIPAARNRRRVHLVNPSFQWKYTICVIVGVFFIYTAMSSVLFAVLSWQARERVLHANVVSVWQNTIVMIAAAAAFAVVLGAALTVWSLIVTHRICGPLSVMQQQLRELKAGRYPRHRPLRKHDEFKDFYEAFWQAVDAIRSREQASLKALSAAAEALDGSADLGPDRADATLQSVGHDIEELRRELASALGDGAPNDRAVNRS